MAFQLINYQGLEEELKSFGYARQSVFAARQCGLACFCCRSVSSTMNSIRAAIESGTLQEEHDEYIFSLPEALTELGSVYLVQADRQTEGRGRDGRVWHSREGGLYLSFGFQLGLAPAELAGFSLAAGVAVHRACMKVGVQGLKLKWPNDLLFVGSGGRPKKLAGILSESFAACSGGHALSAGVGLNLYRQEFPLDVPGVSLSEICRLELEAERVLAVLIHEMLSAALEFKNSRLASFRGEWIEESFYCPGEELKIERGGQALRGIFRGIGPQGELVLVSEGSRIFVNSGEIIDFL